MTYEAFGATGMKVTIQSVNARGDSTSWWYTTEFDGKDIANLYDFTYALRAHKPGDTVLVKVLRGSQTIEAKVLLTERR